MTPQSNFMILAPVAEGKIEALKQLLASMNQAPGYADPHNSTIPFYQFGNLHVARFVVLQANTNEDIREHGVEPGYWQTHLAFIGDIDGPLDIFFAELVLRAGNGLRQIFAHCGGFNPAKTDLLRWMRAHNKRPTANYVNWRGRTVTQIREEYALAHALRGRLAQLTPRDATGAPASPDRAQSLRRDLLEFVQEETASCRLRLSEARAAPPGWIILNVLHLLGVPFVLLLLSPLMLLFAPFFVWRLRALENSDPENTRRPTREHVHALAVQEDLDVTNHFNVFGQVKPGLFRRLTIRVLLIVLDYAARHVYRWGFLTRIQTIHFARWVLLDGDKRVFFASNYDGSQESYMDDFINKVAWGLNLVFSNGVGYPRTHWLIKGGAAFEEKYKRTLRRNQLPSQVWYKAYPDLTAVDLARNARIRKGLEADSLSRDEVQAWLALL